MASPPSGGEVEFVSQRPQAGPDGARFEMRAIKLFIDGAMGSRGGLLFEPYSDDPGNSGLHADRARSARGDDDRGPAPRLAGRHPRDRRQGQRAGPRRLRRRPEGRPRGARPPAADRACAGRPQGRRPPLRRAGRDRLDAALARQRRHAMGRRAARPRAGSTAPTPGDGSSTRVSRWPSAATSPSRSSTRSGGSTRPSPGRTPRAAPPAAGTPSSASRSRRPSAATPPARRMPHSPRTAWASSSPASAPT